MRPVVELEQSRDEGCDRVRAEVGRQIRDAQLAMIVRPEFPLRPRQTAEPVADMVLRAFELDGSADRQAKQLERVDRWLLASHSAGHLFGHASDFRPVARIKPISERGIERTSMVWGYRDRLIIVGDRFLDAAEL